MESRWIQPPGKLQDLQRAKSHKPEDSSGYGQRLHNLNCQVSVIVYTHAIKYTLLYIKIPLQEEGALQEY